MIEGDENKLLKGPGDMSSTELINFLSGHKVFIQTHNFPDADAIGSAFGLSRFLESFDINASIVYVGSIEKYNTSQMIKLLNILMTPFSDELGMCEDDYVVLVDSQKGNANIVDLPGREVVCFDHHQSTGDLSDFVFSSVMPDVGACCSMIADLWFSEGLDIPSDVATGLLYGIIMDTADMTRGVSQLDVQMLSRLYLLADLSIMKNIRANTMEFDDLAAFGEALKTIEVYDYLAIARLDGDFSDGLVAEVSDFILATREVELAVVYAVRSNGVKFAARSEIDSVSAAKLLNMALDGFGSGGGHDSMAGGFMELKMFTDSAESEIQRRLLKTLRKVLPNMNPRN
jgi:nanoRNase/pAp phosphatase (c-di-AMP/oligoRNAs hydrolase)